MLAALILVVFGSENSEARDPEWSYENDRQLYAVATSETGEYIVTGADGEDDAISLFHKDSDVPLWSYETDSGVTNVDISNDGSYIVASHYDNFLVFSRDSSTPIWGSEVEGEDNQTESIFEGNQIESIAISGNGEYVVVSGDEEAGIYLFDRDSSQQLWKYETNSSSRDIAISDDGERIVSADGDKIVLLRNWGNNKGICFEYDTDRTIFHVDISADGKYVVASNDRELYYFDLNSASCNNDPIWIYEHNHNYQIQSLSISADGSTIALGTEGSSDDEVLLLFSKDSEDPLWSYSPDNKVNHLRIPSVQISSDGQSIVAGISTYNRDTNGIYLFSINSNIPKWNFNTGESSVSSVSISDDGEIIAGNTLGSENVSAELFLFTNNQEPTATIDSISPSPAEFGEDMVTFEGTGVDNDGTIIEYQWSSSIDGILSDESSFSVGDLNLGTHTITFRVQDNDGEYGEAVQEFSVYACPVAIAGQNATGTPGVPLQFSGAGTDEDGDITKYEWDFDGDGIFEWSSSENGRELNVYNNEGTYTATLRVTDNDGCTDRDSVVITISEKEVKLDDDGNLVVSDAEDTEEGVPSISIITSLISMGLLAIFRRK